MRQLSPEEIMPMEEYAYQRAIIRQQLRPLKNDRRVPIGPHAVIMFESYQTIWHQVHEMLFVEKGGDEQIHHELEAYNPLIPSAKKLTFTLMFEVENPLKRAAFLTSISQVDRYVFLTWKGQSIQAASIDNQERTRDDGKTSAVHFMAFPFDALSRQSFLENKEDMMVSIRHLNYHHSAALSSSLCQRLKEDLSE